MAPVRVARHRQALAFGRLRVLAHHAHRQAQRRAVQHPGHQRHQQQGQQRQRRLLRQHRHRQPSIGANGVMVGGVSTLGKLTR
jgi:hypothetical protein